MIVQFCGLSGAGKTTLAKKVSSGLKNLGLPVEVLDGDEYRNTLSRDLGFSKVDRCAHLRRMAFVAGILSSHGVVAIISAINPYEEIREEIRTAYKKAYTIFIDCSVAVLKQRDTKGLYRRASLPEGHPDRISNLTGIGDVFEQPSSPDLYVNTGLYSESFCVQQIIDFICDKTGRTVLQEDTCLLTPISFEYFKSQNI